jgi:hypothetical protein
MQTASRVMVSGRSIEPELYSQLRLKPKELSQPYVGLFASLRYAADLSGESLRFDRVVLHYGNPIIVLRACQEGELLEMIAAGCQTVTQESTAVEIASARIVWVRKVKNDPTPEAIGVAIEPL